MPGSCRFTLSPIMPRAIRTYRFVAAKDLAFVCPTIPRAENFLAAYQAALLGQPAPVRDRFVPAAPGTIAALMASYMKSVPLR